MKNLLLFVCAVGLFAGPASAWEFKNNPDRRPSWALGYWKGKLSDEDSQRTEHLALFGSYFLRVDGVKTKTELDTQIIKPSLRLPLSDDVTVDLEYSYILQDFESSNAATIYTGKMRGSTWGGTFRKYF